MNARRALAVQRNNPSTILSTEAELPATLLYRVTSGAHPIRMSDAGSVVKTVPYNT